MDMKLLLSVALLTVFAGGCATQPDENGTSVDQGREVDVRVTEGVADRAVDAADASQDDIICTRVHKVGTNFPKTVCKSRAQREADRREADNLMKRSMEFEAHRRTLEKQGN